MEQVHPLVYEYKQTIIGFDPPAFAKMLEPGASRKYTKIYRRLSNGLLQAHLRGDVTLAVCLINTAGSARAVALDIDEGGEAALIAVLAAARQRNLVAFAQSSPGTEHNGGHVWLLFDGYTEPVRLRYLAVTLAQEAGVSAETYPTRKTIRLPLGIHRWTNRRGSLFLPDHSQIDLDPGEQAVKDAIHALRRLPLNPLSILPPPPQAVSEPIKQVRERRSEGRGTDGDFIADYNHSTDLVGLLESLGGRVAQQLPSGGVLMHCPCPHHKHGDARPSIELRPARNTQRYGDFVVYGYAPTCLFYTERGQVTPTC
jgi:hypothetical protein